MIVKVSIKFDALIGLTILAFSCKDDDKPAPIDNATNKNVESPLDTINIS